MTMRLCSSLLARNFNRLKYTLITDQVYRLLASPVSPTKLPLRYQHQSVVDDIDEEVEETKHVIKKVNEEIHNKSHGRLFAVVHILGKQFKVTAEDIIVVQGNWPPTAGDKIRLEKVLLVGSSNFTLVGRPLLPKDQVAVYATVIEKTMTPTLLTYHKIRRERFTKTILNRYPLSLIRITSIDLPVGVDEIGDVDGLRDRIF